jgi:hypothetical protein
LDAYTIDVLRSHIKIEYLKLETRRKEEKNISASITDKL